MGDKIDKIDKSDEEWHAQLTDEQYAITRQGGTEPAFTGRFYEHGGSGTYRCVCCEAELFSSEVKFDSGSGWPSFYQAFAEDRVRTLADTSHGQERTEIRCARCDAHLGHVFEDGPAPTGQRFCVNSASLDFKDE